MIEAVAKVTGAPRCVPPVWDKDGYHWVRRFRGSVAIPLHWNATWHRNGACGWGMWGQPDREGEWEYLGPCPSPDDKPVQAPIGYKGMRTALEKISGRKEYDPEDHKRAAVYKREEGIWTTDEYLADIALGSADR